MVAREKPLTMEDFKAFVARPNTKLMVQRDHLI
jgi:hypothetical protein